MLKDEERLSRISVSLFLALLFIPFSTTILKSYFLKDLRDEQELALKDKAQVRRISPL